MSNLDLSKGPIVMNRAAVPLGAVFSPGKEAYINLGVLDIKNEKVDLGTRAWSVSRLSGALTQTRNLSRDVTVIGEVAFNFSLYKKDAMTAAKRGKLAPGKLFQVPGSRSAKSGHPILYGNIGEIDGGTLLSINLETRVLSHTMKVDTDVLVMGDYEFVIPKLLDLPKAA